MPLPIRLASRARRPIRSAGARDGGESYADLEQRCIPWIDALERNTVAVTHGGVSRVIRGALLGLDRRLVPTLEVPQDKVLVLEGATARWL